MIVNRCAGNSLFKKCLKTVSGTQSAQIYNRARIGNRDWVCFGYNGSACYMDNPAWPCPSIRFKETTNELSALREKEKGDWRKLTLEEKKTLYRASFRQTLVEVMAPTGRWKTVLGRALFAISLGMWNFILLKLFLYEKPHTLSENYRKHTLRKVLDLKIGHLSGVSSKWDYEKDDWKK